MRIENSCNKLTCSLYICFIYLNIQKRGTNFSRDHVQMMIDTVVLKNLRVKKKDKKNVFSRLRNDKLCTAVS